MQYLSSALFALLVVVTPLSFVSAHGSTTDTASSMMDHWGGSGLWMLGGWITMILVWAFLILGIAAFWKMLNAKKK